MSQELTTNAAYTSLREYYFHPHYFRSRAWKGLRDYYRYCFQARTPDHHNAFTSRAAASEARKPWLSTTMRERYYDKFFLHAQAEKYWRRQERYTGGWARRSQDRV